MYKQEEIPVYPESDGAAAAAMKMIADAQNMTTRITALSAAAIVHTGKSHCSPDSIINLARNLEKYVKEG